MFLVFFYLTSRVSEQRRKKVQELETQIADLKQKQKEQLKLLRMKEQSEQKVNKLNSEIQVRTRQQRGSAFHCFSLNVSVLYIFYCY